jgi:prevent-host-death family protein
MKFVTMREFRNKSSQVWRELSREKDLVITSNGKPIAIMTATDEDHFEEALLERQQVRAMRALKETHKQSVQQGSDKLSPKQIQAEIDEVRRERSE